MITRPDSHDDAASFVHLRWQIKRGVKPQRRLVLDANTFRIYNHEMEFTWSEKKRSLNIEKHGLDFVDAKSVFQGMTYTFEDDRFSYAEQRFITLGMLAGIPVSVVHTENEYEIRIISFRKATTRESQIYFDAIQN